MNNIIAVTMGDPAGISPEVIIKSLSKAGLTGVLVVVMGCMHTLRYVTAMNTTPQTELRIIREVCDAHFAPDMINVMDEPLVNPNALTPGVVQTAAGDLACRCIKCITVLALSGEVKAIATTPLNKEALHLGGHNYPEHTELLVHLTGNKEYAMVLYIDKLKVIHVSTHISLRKLLGTLNGERVKTVIHVASHFPKRVGTERPRIAMAGTNSHAGEHDLFGTEEIEIIVSVIEAIQVESVDVTDLYSPDIVFMQCHEGLFDMVVVMYHDQRYIPLRLFGFYDRANITTGLPFVRTPADHDAMSDIAWAGKARFENMTVPIQLAMQISQE